MNMDMNDLLRYLDGELDEVECAALEERVQGDVALRARLERLRLLHVELRDSFTGDAFAPGFSDRVMRLVRQDGDESPPERTYVSLRWAFARTGMAGVTLAILLGMMNLLNFGDADMFTGWVDTVFAMPSDSLEDALIYTSADVMIFEYGTE